MGLRQPSATGAFFAQMKAGAEQQKQAREKLQKPQALGGSATAGTQMVAATTKAQQAATGQVEQARQQASDTLKVGDKALDSSTATAIAGTPSATPQAAQPQAAGPTQPATPGAAPSTPVPTPKFTGGIAEKAKTDIDTNIKYQKSDIPYLNSVISELTEENKKWTTPPEKKEANKIKIAQFLDYIASAETGTFTEDNLFKALADTGRTDFFETAGKITESKLRDVVSKIEELDNALLTANAEDAKKINEEKARLDKLLGEYRDKLTKENLGKISQSSAFGTELLEREKLLADEDVSNISKLASLFGRNAGGAKTKKYGALESQIYGKDLEAVQEGAKAELIEKATAESAADLAEKQYEKQLDISKKGYEESVKTAQDRLEVLKASPQELAGYTKDELLKLFNNDAALVDQLFTFDDKGKVTNTKSSQTRKALVTEETALKDRLAKLPGAKEVAKTVADAKVDKEIKDIEAEIFGSLTSEGKNISAGFGGLRSKPQTELAGLIVQRDELNSIPEWRRQKGHSSKSAALDGKIAAIEKYLKEVDALEQVAEKVRKTKDINQLKRIRDRREELYRKMPDFRQDVMIQWGEG